MHKLTTISTNYQQSILFHLKGMIRVSQINQISRSKQQTSQPKSQTSKNHFFFFLNKMDIIQPVFHLFTFVLLNNNFFNQMHQISQMDFRKGKKINVKFVNQMTKIAKHTLLKSIRPGYQSTPCQLQIDFVNCHNLQYFAYMNPNSKRERKEKIDFKVKFSENESMNSSAASREMILSARHRALKNFTSKSSYTIEQRQKEESSINEDENEIKKQNIQIQSKPSRQIESSIPNSSSIVNTFDVLSSFFQEQVIFKLIYRASNHSFSITEFHDICDAYDDTLTLCLTEDNKIIGGYTPLSWEDQFHKSSTHFKTDFRRQTFLFSVTDKAKYPLAKSLKNKAICCFKSFGPTFGGGYDLLIGDRCNELPNATSYFPRNFQHPSGPNFSKRDFAGTSRKNFKLQQWEVFHVIKANSMKTIQALHFTQPKQQRLHQQELSLWEKIKTATAQLIGALCNDK